MTSLSCCQSLHSHLPISHFDLAAMGNTYGANIQFYWPCALMWVQLECQYYNIRQKWMKKMNTPLSILALTSLLMKEMEKTVKNSEVCWALGSGSTGEWTMPRSSSRRPSTHLGTSNTIVSPLHPLYWWHTPALPLCSSGLDHLVGGFLSPAEPKGLIWTFKSQQRQLAAANMTTQWRWGRRSGTYTR